MPRRPDLTIDTPTSDEGHETIRLALVAARAAIGDLRADLAAARADIAALTTRVNALSPPPAL